MSTVIKYQELEIWQMAINIATEIYRFTNEEPLKRDYSMRDQMRRSATAISNNIVEGFEYNNNNDFIRFLRYAKGSVGELRNQFLILKNSEMIEAAYYTKMDLQLELLGKRCGAFIKYLKDYTAKTN